MLVAQASGRRPEVGHLRIYSFNVPGARRFAEQLAELLAGYRAEG